MHHLLFLLHVDKSLLTEGLREASYPLARFTREERLIELIHAVILNVRQQLWW